MRRLRQGSFEDAAREVKADDPVRHVDDFGYAQITADRTEHIGIRRRHSPLRAKQINHVGHRIPRRRHQSVPDPGCRLIALRVEMPRHRPRCGEARGLEVRTLDQIEV